MTMAIRTHDDDDDDEEEQEDGDGMCLMKIGGTKGSVAMKVLVALLAVLRRLSS